MIECMACNCEAFEDKIWESSRGVPRIWAVEVKIEPEITTIPEIRDCLAEAVAALGREMGGGGGNRGGDRGGELVRRKKDSN
jgi:hypothetical protein